SENLYSGRLSAPTKRLTSCGLSTVNIVLFSSRIWICSRPLPPPSCLIISAMQRTIAGELCSNREPQNADRAVSDRQDRSTELAEVMSSAERLPFQTTNRQP